MYFLDRIHSFFYILERKLLAGPDTKRFRALMKEHADAVMSLEAVLPCQAQQFCLGRFIADIQKCYMAGNT